MSLYVLNLFLLISSGFGIAVGFVMNISILGSTQIQTVSSALSPSFTAVVSSSTNSLVANTMSNVHNTVSSKQRSFHITTSGVHSSLSPSNPGITSSFRTTPALPWSSTYDTSTVTSVPSKRLSTAYAITLTVHSSASSTLSNSPIVSKLFNVSNTVLNPSKSANVFYTVSTTSHFSNISYPVSTTSTTTVNYVSTSLMPRKISSFIYPSAKATQSTVSLSSIISHRSFTVQPTVSSQIMNPSSAIHSSIQPSSVSSLSSSRTSGVIPSNSTTPSSFVGLTFLTKGYPLLTPTLSPSRSTVSNPSLPKCAYTRTCCVHGMGQLPANIDFKESEKPGYILARMDGMWNVSLAVTIDQPLVLQAILRDYLATVNTGDTYSLTLMRDLDLEDMYIKANRKKDVHQFQIQVHCLEHGRMFLSRLINVTVEDVDDSMPVFEHDGSGPSCVVPVYTADTDELYTGELQITPGRIKAVDGDLTQRHNVTYNVMHSEPEDYHNYFHLNPEVGTVNKTRTMNASDPRKFVLFVQATEDSPSKRNRVAILSIGVYAPLADGEAPVTVDPAVKYALQIISALVLLAFASGFLVILNHRYRLRKTKVDPGTGTPGVVQDVRMPKLAFYKSSCASLNSLIPDIPVITSPSQVAVTTRDKDSQKKKKVVVIVKKPLDTHARPSWNAPPPKARRASYNPYEATQKIKKQ